MHDLVPEETWGVAMYRVCSMQGSILQCWQAFCQNPRPFPVECGDPRTGNTGEWIDLLEVLYVRLKADLIWLFLEKRRACGPTSGLALNAYFLNPRP